MTTEIDVGQHLARRPAAGWTRPSAIAACTNSFSRTDSTLPRTGRATYGM